MLAVCAWAISQGRSKTHGMPPGQCSTGLEWGLHGIFGGGGVGSSIALTLISSSSVELAGMPSRATSPAENSDPFSLDFSCLCPDPVLVKVILN